MANTAKRVVIVGGGVIGLCAAYYALEKGFAVTVLERNTPTHDGCSTGNAGMIVPSHFVPLAAPGMVAYGLRQMGNPRSPFYIRPRLDKNLLDWGVKFVRAATRARVEKAAPVLRDLNLESRAAYEGLSEDLGGDGFGLTKRGLLLLCATEAALQEETHIAGRAHALNIPADVLTPDAAARVDPGVQMTVAGAVYYPLDCHLDPRKFLAALTRALERGGAILRYGAEVTGWRTESGRLTAVCLRCVNGGGEEIPGDEFVIAGGSWSPDVARGLHLSLPMQAGKGYSVTVQQPPELPQVCSILTEARVAVTPMGDSLRIGGTMELSGRDETVRPERVAGILASIPRYFPAFTPDHLRGLPVWKGLRPCSPDGLPYVGRTRRWKNLCLATGHAMMGLSLGPVTGKLIAQTLCGETPSVDLALLDPDRYG